MPLLGMLGREIKHSSDTAEMAVLGAICSTCSRLVILSSVRSRDDTTHRTKSLTASILVLEFTVRDVICCQDYKDLASSHDNRMSVAEAHVQR
jgi:hypothetical protein